MNEVKLPPEIPGDTRLRFWYSFLSDFPFLYIPIIAFISIVLTIVMPYITGVAR